MKPETKLNARRRLREEFVAMMRYSVVGVTAYLVNLAIFIILTDWFGVHYLIANGIGYIAIVVVSYVLSVKWVFTHRRLKSHRKEFFAFTFITVGAMAISTCVMYFFVDILGWNDIVSNVVTSFLQTAWGYVPKRLFLFSEGKHLSGDTSPETYDFERPSQADEP